MWSVGGKFGETTPPLGRPRPFFIGPHPLVKEGRKC